MKKSFSIENKIKPYNTEVNIEFEDKCPMCHSHLSLDPIHGIVHASREYDEILSLFCRCSNCGELYINRYTNPMKAPTKISSEPKRFIKRIFEDSLLTLSPEFDEIYNQARAAESSGLHQIAGIGYRKAVEFLIKDYAIFKHPDKSEDIKNMLLSKCINTYIDDEKIKSLAIKTVWIGNDETHYVRKHNDRDINDLKKFIDAVVYFINIDFIMQDAETITPA